MVGILLVTHGEIGLALYTSAIHILGKKPGNIDYISIIQTKKLTLMKKLS